MDPSVRDIGGFAHVPVVEAYVDAGEKVETDQMKSRKRVALDNLYLNTS